MSQVRPCIRCGAIERDAAGHCRACCRERSKAYRAANRERAAAAVASWAKANRERKKALDAKSYEANRERRNKQTAEWVKKHPQRRAEIARRAEHLRRAQKRASGGRLSVDIVSRLLVLQRGKCACCKASIQDRNHIDHIQPLARGGANTDENVQLLCPQCNGQKSAKDPIDFMQQKGFLL